MECNNNDGGSRHHHLLCILPDLRHSSLLFCRMYCIIFCVIGMPGADGTFDILKYADPELDVDDPNNLMDTLDFIDDSKTSVEENLKTFGEGKDDGGGDEKPSPDK